jgi:hypothetical protein
MATMNNEGQNCKTGYDEGRVIVRGEGKSRGKGE